MGRCALRGHCDFGRSCRGHRLPGEQRSRNLNREPASLPLLHTLRRPEVADPNPDAGADCNPDANAADCDSAECGDG